MTEVAKADEFAEVAQGLMVKSESNEYDIRSLTSDDANRIGQIAKLVRESLSKGGNSVVPYRLFSVGESGTVAWNKKGPDSNPDDLNLKQPFYLHLFSPKSAEEISFYGPIVGTSLRIGYMKNGSALVEGYVQNSLIDDVLGHDAVTSKKTALALALVLKEFGMLGYGDGNAISLNLNETQLKYMNENYISKIDDVILEIIK